MIGPFRGARPAGGNAETAAAEYVLHGLPPKFSGYLRSVFLPRRDFKAGDMFSRLRVVQPGLRIERSHLAAFRKAGGAAPADHLPFDYPLSLLFHYHLGIFAHPRFPCSLRKLLGVRTRVVQRRRIALAESLDLEVRTGNQRLLPKGVEFDFHTVLASGGEPVWESISVYYLRGPFGGADPRPAQERLAPLDTVEFEVRWDAPRGGGLEFARLSGDFNPVHYFPGWARRLGFERDFAHTQIVVAHCLRRLPEPLDAMDAEPLCLDIAYKGPVYYGSRLTMKGARKGDGYRFDLYCGEADRPAVPGSLQRVRADHPLASS